MLLRSPALLPGAVLLQDDPWQLEDVAAGALPTSGPSLNLLLAVLQVGSPPSCPALTPWPQQPLELLLTFLGPSLALSGRLCTPPFFVNLVETLGNFLGDPSRAHAQGKSKDFGRGGW